MIAFCPPFADQVTFEFAAAYRHYHACLMNVVVTGRTVNDEQQAYVDSPETIAVADGALAIIPRRKPGFKTPEGRSFDFVSGRLDTRSKFQFTYGTAEARIKLTAGAGLWPAFWALGNGRWPDSGEMDILENVGDPTWTNFAVHGPGYSGDKCFDFPWSRPGVCKSGPAPN